MIRKLAIAVVFALFIHYTTTSANVQAPNIDSPSILISSSLTNQIIYERDSDIRFPPGALTHGMTAIAALSTLDADALVTIPQEIREHENLISARAHLQPGETFTVRTLVQTMLVGNGDDAALALALHATDNNLPEFVEKMNEMAKEIGATNTNFETPTGRTLPNTHTTAADIALIYRHAWSMPTIQTALTMVGIVLPASNFAQERGFRTNNYIFDDFIYSQYHLPSAIGGKTGYFGREVCNVVVFGRQDGMDVMVVVMGGRVAPNGNILSLFDGRTGLRFAFSEFQSRTVVNQGDILHEIRISGAARRHILQLEAEDSLRILTRRNSDIEPILTVRTESNTARAPIAVGDILGDVDISYDGQFIASVPLISSEDIASSAFGVVGGVFSTIFGSVIFRVLLGLAIVLFLYKALYLDPKRRREARKLQRRKAAEERRRQNRDM